MYGGIFVKLSVDKIIAEIDKLVLELGFKRRKKKYYRLMDGYVQSFMVYTNRESFSIRFFQLPFCANVGKNFEGDDVSIFWSDKSEPFSLIQVYMPTFEYIPYNPFGIILTSENYQDKAAEMLVRSVNEYVLPYFQCSSNLEKAYEAEHKLKTAFVSRGCEKQNVSNYAEEMYSECFGNWNIQMKQYNEAERYMKIYLKSLQEYGSDNTEELQKLINALEIHDSDYVENYIESHKLLCFSAMGIK